MEDASIRAVADGLHELLEESGFGEHWLHESGRVLDVICRLHLEAGLESYDQGVIDAFAGNARSRHARGEICSGSMWNYTRVARLLTEYHDTGGVDFTKRPRDAGLPPGLQAALDAADANPDWGDKAATSVKNAVRPFLKWLKARGVNSIADVGEADIRAYFIEISGRMRPGSVYGIRNSMRRLFARLHAESLVGDSFAGALSFPVRPERRIQRPASADELAMVLESIDRSDPKGKRDYAMLMLGAALGLRRSDIAGLKLGDVDWANGEVAVRQLKTGRVVALPLTADVGEALLDYILRGRPDSDDPHVFLRHRNPPVPLGPSVPYQVLNAYRGKLGLPRAPFHGLRRAVATNLVAAGSPVTTVAQVLGHSGIEPARQYISLDTAALKSVSLGLSGLPPLGKDGAAW